MCVCVWLSSVPARSALPLFPYRMPHRQSLHMCGVVRSAGGPLSSDFGRSVGFSKRDSPSLIIPPVLSALPPAGLRFGGGKEGGTNPV